MLDKHLLSQKSSILIPVSKNWIQTGMIFITRTKIKKIHGTEPQFHLYVEVKSEPELEYIFSKIKEIITKHKPAGNCH
jgi:hypothetical protein